MTEAFHPRIVSLPNATITELGITELFYYGLLSPNSTITECYYYRTGYYRTVLLRFIITECCTLDYTTNTDRFYQGYSQASL